MRPTKARRYSRRTVLKASLAAALAPRGVPPATAAAPLITKPIPKTGEQLPVVGLGTNNFSVATPEELAARRAVLQAFASEGGRVVDTARAYGESEVVLGELMAGSKLRPQLFLATKMPMGGNSAGEGADPAAVLDEAFRRLQVERIDLMQVHNFAGLDTFLPALLAAKQAGRVRYVGVTTSTAGQYPQMIEALKTLPLDFIQVNYSLANRGAGDEVLPLARDKGVAVLANMPLGGRRGNLMATLAGKPLPGYAQELGATSWAQLLIKYVVSHPAVTVAIPGATRVEHLDDNLNAGRGALPDAAMRKRMEEEWG